MNFGAIVLLGYLYYRYSKKKGDAGTGAVIATAGQQYSFRTVLVSVLTVTVFFSSMFYLLEACQPYLTWIGLEWVRDVCAFTVSIIVPIIVLRCGPPWLAWRILRPLRHPFPARFIFWFTPGQRKSALVGFTRLVVASSGKDPFYSGQPSSSLKKRLRVFFMLDEQGVQGDLDAWAVAAAALQAEIAGDPEKAGRYIDSFGLLARRSQVPRLVRIFAFEQFALHAARRGDWERVAGCAAFGTGRSMPLLRLLARGHLSGQVNRVLLFFCWFIAPCRIATFPLLRSLLAQRKILDARTVEESPVESFPLSHLRLLKDAADGSQIGLAPVLSLALAWQSMLTSESYAMTLARGMELGARDSQGTVDAIPQALLDELEELAVAGSGTLPVEILENWEEWRETLAGAVIVRLRNRLFCAVEDSASQFFRDEEEQVPLLLQCWEQWLAMHAATERLGALMGMEDVATAWYGGLQINAWNGACRVFNTYGKDSAWISYCMFTWVVTVAEKIGDEEAAKVNRKNAAVCGIPEFTTFEAFLELPKKVFVSLLNIIKRVFSLSWWQWITPRIWKNVHKAVLNRITIVLPLGGIVIAVILLSSIWSFGDVFIGSLVGLPVVVTVFVLLYLLAMRIEKKHRKDAADPS
jgi:hypothetical protein